MGRKSIKEHKNIYQQAREDLNLTRDKAEELLQFISADRIEKIEAGKTLIRPEEVLCMAKCYKKPELTNYYCSNECPIGRKYISKIDEKELSQITLEILGSLNSLEKIKDRLIEITVDGTISEDELNDFSKIKDGLNDLKNTIDSLSLWFEKQESKKSA